VALRPRLHSYPSSRTQSTDRVRCRRALPGGDRYVGRDGPARARRPGLAAPIGVRAELYALPLARAYGAPFSAHVRAMPHAPRRPGGARRRSRGGAHRMGAALPVALLAIFQPSDEADPPGPSCWRTSSRTRIQAAVARRTFNPSSRGGRLRFDSVAGTRRAPLSSSRSEGEPSTRRTLTRALPVLRRAGRRRACTHARALDRPALAATLNVGSV